MAELVKVRRLSDEEGQRLLQIVRRGEPRMTKSVIRYRRAMVVLASASGNTVPAIARLVAADEDTVRGGIHRFNELGMGGLGPRWAGGRPAVQTTGAGGGWPVGGGVPAPAGSALRRRISSLRRPVPAPRSWAARSRTGACAS